MNFFNVQRPFSHVICAFLTDIQKGVLRGTGHSEAFINSYTKEFSSEDYVSCSSNTGYEVMCRKQTAARYEDVISLRRKRSFLNMKKRDREPSCIPLKRILSCLKNKLRRTRFRHFVKLSVPNSSFNAHLCKHCKLLKLYYYSDNFYSKYAFIIKVKKPKLLTSCNRYTDLHQTHVKVSYDGARQMKWKFHIAPINNCLSLRGGMSPDTINFANSSSPLNILSERLALIGLMPHDVGGFGDCFFRSISHQL